MISYPSVNSFFAWLFRETVLILGTSAQSASLAGRPDKENHFRSIQDFLNRLCRGTERSSRMSAPSHPRLVFQSSAMPGRERSLELGPSEMCCVPVLEHPCWNIPRRKSLSIHQVSVRLAQAEPAMERHGQWILSIRSFRPDEPDGELR
ncbi:MAG: hypothetical protein DWH78_01065 [Planctomycetota bacterium]|nr:MAG: hypothetical protein DWH78_01065 [Planctomycetota bacterium]